MSSLKKIAATCITALVLLTSIPTSANAALSTDSKATLDEIIASLSGYGDITDVITYLYSGYVKKLSGDTTTTGSGSTGGQATPNTTTETPSTVTSETPGANTQICEYAKGITKTLSLRTNDPQVKTLQKLLNALAKQDSAYKPVIASGDGSYGYETTYFGTGTQAAVKRLQQNLRMSYTTGMYGPLTSAAVKKKFCDTPSGQSTAKRTISTGTTPVGAPSVGDLSSGSGSEVTSNGLVLSHEPVAGIPNVFKQVLTGMTAGYTCTFMPYNYNVLSLNSTNPTMLAQQKLPTQYGLYWEEYSPLGSRYMKIKQDIAFRAECSNGMVSNFAGMTFTAGGSGNPEDTLEASGGVKVEILQKSNEPVYRSPSETYTVSGLAYGLKRLEVKFSGLHGTGSCDIGLGDATSVGEGKAWSCSRESSNLGPGNVTVQFIGTTETNEIKDLGDYKFVVKRFVGDKLYD